MDNGIHAFVLGLRPAAWLFFCPCSREFGIVNRNPGVLCRLQRCLLRVTYCRSNIGHSPAWEKAVCAVWSSFCAAHERTHLDGGKVGLPRVFEPGTAIPGNSCA